MTQNEGEPDRIARSVVGVILVLVGFSVGDGWWQIGFYVFGGLLIITGISGFCLIYKLFGLSTNK